MMIDLCKQLLANPNSIILDTETTGLNNYDEVIQIACIDMRGKVLLNTFVRPYHATISAGAYQVHGIRERQLIDAPRISELNLQDLLRGRIVAVYNAGFDSRLLKQSALAGNHLDLAEFLTAPCWINFAQKPYPTQAFWFDLMEPYARFWGEPKKNGGYRWQSLTNACLQQGIDSESSHSALEDAQLTLALLNCIAGNEIRQGNQLQPMLF